MRIIVSTQVRAQALRNLTRHSYQRLYFITTPPTATEEITKNSRRLCEWNRLYYQQRFTIDCKLKVGVPHF